MEVHPVLGPRELPELLPIPAHEAQAVRSASSLSSLWHAVEICCINSVEAAATEVHIELDFGTCSFKINDNGHGLAPEGMSLLGSWNITSKSKLHNQLGGHRGEGLASICSTAVVEITSRAAGSFETHSCLIRAEELLQIKLATEQRSRSGTVISVRDLFFNRPVTRKALTNSG